MEAVEKMHSNPRGRHSNTVHTFSVSKNTVANIPHSRCEGDGHTAQVCCFKEATCHTCSKKGHLTKACRSKYRGWKGLLGSRRLIDVPVLTFESQTDHPIMVTVDMQANGWKAFNHGVRHSRGSVGHS